MIDNGEIGIVGGMYDIERGVAGGVFNHLIWAHS